MAFGQCLIDSKKVLKELIKDDKFIGNDSAFAHVEK